MKTTSILGVGAIADGKETRYYASLLDDPKYKDKDYAMAVIWEVGTKEALPSVMKYAEKMLSGKIKPYTFPRYYQYIIQYLSTYPSEEVNDIVRRLKALAAKFSAPKIMSKQALQRFHDKRPGSA